MDTQQLMILVFAGTLGVAVALGIFGVISIIGVVGNDNRMRQRLKGQAIEHSTGGKVNVGGALTGLANKISESVAKPFVDEKGERRNANRKKLISAGIYGTDAPRLLVGVQMLCTFGGLAFGFVLHLAAGWDWLFTIPVGGVIGYMLPKLWLSTMIRKNHKALESGLPDGLDLMVVCVEAGLTIDAAMQRVGEELQLAHPALARELSICHMETRIGLPRQTSLKNLGERTNFVPLQALAAMLIQADRFGTSIAKALRIQAESMRTKRQHKAEESAAKASVKLTFPLVLFIFPATFIVLMGPTILKMAFSSVFS